MPLKAVGGGGEATAKALFYRLVIFFRNIIFFYSVFF
jgi:hypothetical protein